MGDMILFHCRDNGAYFNNSAVTVMGFFCVILTAVALQHNQATLAKLASMHPQVNPAVDY